ncbi:hypothetical protein [Kitasatospora sp. NPDC001175]|uniref:hypothetical protein n=1 Tax=Kitasatospora sp. NPDC001175 TaxID=3157103 RepID=UPI003D07315E
MDVLGEADRYGRRYSSGAQVVWAEVHCGRGRADVERAGAGPKRVTVEIEDITEPATFGRLSDALAAAWESMRVLPLGVVQADAFRYFLTRPDAAEHAAEFIRRNGRLELTFAMSGRSHAVRIRWADPTDQAPSVGSDRHRRRGVRGVCGPGVNGLAAPGG